MSSTSPSPSNPINIVLSFTPYVAKTLADAESSFRGMLLFGSPFIFLPIPPTFDLSRTLG